MKLLFTCVGRRVELLEGFRKAAKLLSIQLVLYGTDSDSDAPALIYCDKQKIINRIDHNDYIQCLLAFCISEKIDAVIPTIDTDLIKLSSAKAEFASHGIKIIICDLHYIMICRDKRETGCFFKNCGLQTPESVNEVSSYKGGFPCFIKPLNGSSSIGANKAGDSAELEYFASRLAEYIIQPYIEGMEYTVDILCDLQGNPIYITPRKRLSTRSGEVMKTQIDLDDEIIRECKLLLKSFRACGAITVQMIKEKNTGRNIYIEINPRFGGGSPLSMRAGANTAIALLQILSSTELIYNEARADVIYSRFDHSVRVAKIRTINHISDILSDLSGIRAVIFDLDDTLYSEKEYVRSGFRAVADYLSDTNIYEQLYSCFEQQLKPFDAVFQNEKQRAEYLAVYRSHKPDIRLYDDARETLNALKEYGIAVGIITDGRPEGQRAKLKALGLSNIADEIIITDEVGGPQFRKPNDIAFRIMQGRLNLPYENMAYVGDNASKDFLAPRVLGMSCFHFINSEGLYSI